VQSNSVWVRDRPWGASQVPWAVTYQLKGGELGSESIADIVSINVLNQRVGGIEYILPNGRVDANLGGHYVEQVERLTANGVYILYGKG